MTNEIPDGWVVVSPYVGERLIELGVPVSFRVDGSPLRVANSISAPHGEPPLVPAWAKLIWDLVKEGLEHRPRSLVSPMVKQVFSRMMTDPAYRAEVIVVISCLDSVDRPAALFEMACTVATPYCQGRGGTCRVRLQTLRELVRGRCEHCIAAENENNYW